MIFQMMKKNNNQKYAWILWLFIGLSVLNLSAELLNSQWLIYVTKPLLLPILALYFIRQTRQSAFRTSIFIGFLFSALGDTLLMFSQPGFFIAGLLAFLTAHLMYLRAFLIFPFREMGLLWKRPVWSLLFFAYLLLNVRFLWPYLPEGLNYAVVIYSFCIIAMAAAAFNMKNRVVTNDWQVLMLGAVLFIFSDTLIAVNKFTPFGEYIPTPRIAIMTTYLIGQLLIGISCIRIANTQDSNTTES